MVARRGRDADRARLGETFHAGGNVDPVAEQVRAIDDNIANMDADAEPHQLVTGVARVLLRDCRLHRDGALDGINRAGEVGDDAVTGGVEDAAAVRRDQPVHDHAARLKPVERANLVMRHQPAVAGNVSGEDRCELSFDGLTGHTWLLPISL